MSNWRGVSRWSGRLLALHVTGQLMMNYKRPSTGQPGSYDRDDEDETCPMCDASMTLQRVGDVDMWVCQANVAHVKAVSDT